MHLTNNQRDPFWIPTTPLILWPWTRDIQIMAFMCMYCRTTVTWTGLEPRKLVPAKGISSHPGLVSLGTKERVLARQVEWANSIWAIEVPLHIALISPNKKISLLLFWPNILTINTIYSIFKHTKKFTIPSHILHKILNGNTTIIHPFLSSEHPIHICT